MTPGEASTPSDSGTPADRWSDRREWQRAARLALPGGATRLVVVAAHPDEETQAAGGLMAVAARAGLEVSVVLLTDGSRLGSQTVDPEEGPLGRAEESGRALRALAAAGTLQLLGLADGAVADHEEAVVTALVDLVGEEGRHTLLVAPWRDDGVADHDAAGRAAGVAARRTGATLWEYPVRLWNRCDPETAPWPHLHVLPLPEDVRESKRAAVRVHGTQPACLSDEAGGAAVMREGTPEHVSRDDEAFFVGLEPVRDDSLERLHDSDADPWQVRSSWYEQRKRLVTLAALPHPRYGRGLEVGGSVGALAADLAERCDELVVVDESAAATAAARASLGGVRVLRASVPEEWPDGGFDLVVVSEVGYFLSPERLRRLVARTEASLSDDGVVVLCHWRHPVRGWPLDGARVHEIWREESGLPVVATHVEADFRLEVLTRTSVHRAGSA